MKFLLNIPLTKRIKDCYVRLLITFGRTLKIRKSFPSPLFLLPCYLAFYVPVFKEIALSQYVPGFSLVFSTTGKGPFQTGKAHLQLQAAGHSQLCHFLKHTVHRAYQKFSIEKFIM